MDFLSCSSEQWRALAWVCTHVMHSHFTHRVFCGLWLSAIQYTFLFPSHITTSLPQHSEDLTQRHTLIWTHTYKYWMWHTLLRSGSWWVSKKEKKWAGCCAMCFWLLPQMINQPIHVFAACPVWECGCVSVYALSLIRSGWPTHLLNDAWLNMQQPFWSIFFYLSEWNLIFVHTEDKWHLVSSKFTHCNQSYCSCAVVLRHI